MKKDQTLYNTVRTSISMLGLAALLVGAPVVAEARVLDTPKVEKKTSDKIAIREIGNLKFQVVLNKPLSERVFVTIVDTDRNTLYSGSITRTDVKAQIFDLSQLADGSYSIEVAVGDEKISQSFDIKTQVNRVALARN